MLTISGWDVSAECVQICVVHVAWCMFDTFVWQVHNACMYMAYQDLHQ